MTIIIAFILIFFIFVLTFLYGINGFWVSFFISVFVLYSSIRIVKPNRVMTVEFLWKYTRLLRQGFHMIIPLVEVTTQQELYKKNFSVEVIWVTSDNVTVTIWLNVVYFVEDDKDNSEEGNVFKSVYSIDDPTTLMKSTIDEQLRSMIFNFNHKEIFGKRSEVWQDIESSLRKKLFEFGYRIDSIQVKDVILNNTVMSAMNKIKETEKLKSAAFNNAEAAKITKVKDAEADKEAQILLWQGMAWQRKEIAKWFKEAIDDIKSADENLSAADILQFLLDSSRIETLERVGSNSGSRLVYLNENLEWKTDNFTSKVLAWSDIVWTKK